MKVKELIEALQKLSPNDEVYYDDTEGETPVNAVHEFEYTVKRSINSEEYELEFVAVLLSRYDVRY